MIMRTLLRLSFLLSVVGAGLVFYFMWRKLTVRDYPALSVMTYSSFQSHWGPGPELAELFFKQEKIKIEYVDVGDAGLMIQRLKFLPEEKLDIVLGLDQLQISEALK